MRESNRWKQRFENLKKIFNLLDLALKLNPLSPLERSGFLRIYNLTFELSWKTMKDFLLSEGIEVASPRECFQSAFQAKLIQDGHLDGCA